MNQRFKIEKLQKEKRFIKSLDETLKTQDDINSPIENNLITVVHPINRENILEIKGMSAKLEKWACQNKRIVIAASSLVLVLCTTSFNPKNPIVLFNDEKEKNIKVLLNQSDESTTLESDAGILKAGFYYVDENHVIVNNLEKTSATLIEANRTENQEIVLQMTEEMLKNKTLSNTIYEMIEEYIKQTTEKKEEEQQKIEEATISEEEKYIELYCNVYGLNYEKVYQILSDITDNFTDEKYTNEYIIGESMLKRRHVVCTNKEMAILIAVRNMYYDSERYGYQKDDLKTGIEYESQFDYAHQISYISEVLEVDKTLNYAICKTTSNHFKNEVFLEKNNAAGLVFSESYAVFPSKTAGFIEQSLELLKYKIDGKTTFEEIGIKYVPNKSAYQVWSKDVIKNYNEAVENYDKLFELQEREAEKEACILEEETEEIKVRQEEAEENVKEVELEQEKFQLLHTEFEDLSEIEKIDLNLINLPNMDIILEENTDTKIEITTDFSLQELEENFESNTPQQESSLDESLEATPNEVVVESEKVPSETQITNNPTKDTLTSIVEEAIEERRKEQEEEEKRRQEEEAKRLEEERVREEKEYIRLYCNIYGLNYEIVYQTLSDITDDFKDEEYLNNYVIGESRLEDVVVDCTSKEMAFVVAIRNIFRYPNRYGYTLDELKTGVEYISDLDYSHQIAYVCNIFEVDPALSWAICYSESQFDSPKFRNKNNAAGIKWGNDFARFPSKTAGFIEQAIILFKYRSYGRTTIASIGAKYCPTSCDPMNSNWIPNVTSNYSKALANYEELFEYSEFEELELAQADKMMSLSR